MNFSIIVATDINNGIGNLNLDFEHQLPWKCSPDMKFFKNLTMGDNNAVIMGKNTFFTLPDIKNGLNKRHNIVLTHNANNEMKDSNVHYTESIDDALIYCKEKNFDKVFVIGGKNVYEQALFNTYLENIYWNIIPEKYRTQSSTVFFPFNFIETMNQYNNTKTQIDDINCYKFYKKNLKMDSVNNPEEMQYLNICRKILDEGHLQEGRNGFTKSIFGTSMRFSLQNNKIPIFTTKKVAWKTCLKELLWFISGNNSDNNVLREQNVHIWNGNSTREYLDSIGLTDFNENELGKIYGEQWRHFNETYIPQKYRTTAKELNYDSKQGFEQINDDLDNIYTAQHRRNIVQINNFKIDNNVDIDDIDIDIDICEDNDNLLFNNIDKLKNKINFITKFQPKQNIDQLQYIIDCLKDPLKRFSRRLIMTAFNPCQLDSMALPPCHVMAHWNVHNINKLSCIMYQRSCDTFIGASFNTCSYAFLTHLLAQHCGLEAYEFVHFIGNTHIYDDHFEQVEEQLKREPFEFPTIEIQSIKENINNYVVEDFKINNYQCHAQIKATMRA